MTSTPKIKSQVKCQHLSLSSYVSSYVYFQRDSIISLLVMTSWRCYVNCASPIFFCSDTKAGRLKKKNFFLQICVSEREMENKIGCCSLSIFFCKCYLKSEVKRTFFSVILHVTLMISLNVKCFNLIKIRNPKHLQKSDLIHLKINSRESHLTKIPFSPFPLFLLLYRKFGRDFFFISLRFTTVICRSILHVIGWVCFEEK